MAFSKQHRPHRANQALMAIGSSGPWEIAVDQTTSGPDRWFAQIEGPAVYLHFEIPSLQIIEQALEFLGLQGETGANPAQNALRGILALSAGSSTRVRLVRDDEFSDRYFLVIKPQSGLLVQFTVSGEDLKDVVQALRQFKDDLE